MFVNNAMRHGNLYEKTALQLFSEKFGVHVKECGMTLNKRYRGIFGCSPDGVFMKNNVKHLIEIKCPYIKPGSSPDQVQNFLNVEGYDKKKIDQQLTKLGKTILGTKSRDEGFRYGQKLYLKSCAYGVLPMHWLQMMHQFASTGITQGYYVVYRRVSSKKFKLTCLRVKFDPDMWQNIVWPKLSSFLFDLHHKSFTDSATFFKFVKEDKSFFNKENMDERAKELWGLLKNETIKLDEEVFNLKSFFENHGRILEF